MSSFRKHLHRCTCGRYIGCLLDCELTTELIGGDGSGRPPGPREHGGSGAMYLSSDTLLCGACDPKRLSRPALIKLIEKRKEEFDDGEF